MKKSKKFIRKLHDKLQNEGIVVTKKKLKEQLKIAVASLPEGPLKDDLENQFKVYLTMLQRLLDGRLETVKEPSSLKKQKTVREDLLTDEDNKHLEAPYNFCIRESCVLNQRLADCLSPEIQQKVYCHYLVQKLKHNMITDMDKALIDQTAEAISSKYTSNIPFRNTRVYQHLLTGITTAAAVENLMKEFMMMMTSVVQKCVEKKKVKSAKKLATGLQDFLSFCHMKTQQLPRSSAFCNDVAAALMSMLVDLHITASRKAEDKTVIASQICLQLYAFIGHNPTFMLDVILQVTLFKPEHKDIMYPLTYKVLMSLPDGLTCMQYLKYILAVKMTTDILGKSETAELRKKALDTPAPTRFWRWLEELNSMLLHEVPLKLRGNDMLAVTKYLLKPAQTDLCNRILDSFNLQVMAPVLGTEPSDQHQPLFSIDKATNSVDVYQDEDKDDAQSKLDDTLVIMEEIDAESDDFDIFQIDDQRMTDHDTDVESLMNGDDQVEENTESESTSSDEEEENDNEQEEHETQESDIETKERSEDKNGDSYQVMEMRSSEDDKEEPDNMSENEKNKSKDTSKEGLQSEKCLSKSHGDITSDLSSDDEEEMEEEEQEVEESSLKDNRQGKMQNEKISKLETCYEYGKHSSVEYFDQKFESEVVSVGEKIEMEEEESKSTVDKEDGEEEELNVPEEKSLKSVFGELVSGDTIEERIFAISDYNKNVGELGNDGILLKPTSRSTESALNEENNVKRINDDEEAGDISRSCSENEKSSDDTESKSVCNIDAENETKVNLNRKTISREMGDSDSSSEGNTPTGRKQSDFDEGGNLAAGESLESIFKKCEYPAGEEKASAKKQDTDYEKCSISPQQKSQFSIINSESGVKNKELRNDNKLGGTEPATSSGENVEMNLDKTLPRHLSKNSLSDFSDDVSIEGDKVEVEHVEKSNHRLPINSYLKSDKGNNISEKSKLEPELSVSCDEPSSGEKSSNSEENSGKVFDEEDELDETAETIKSHSARKPCKSQKIVEADTKQRTQEEIFEVGTPEPGDEERFDDSHTETERSKSLAIKYDEMFASLESGTSELIDDIHLSEQNAGINYSKRQTDAGNAKVLNLSKKTKHEGETSKETKEKSVEDSAEKGEEAWNKVNDINTLNRESKVSLKSGVKGHCNLRSSGTSKSHNPATELSSGLRSAGPSQEVTEETINEESNHFRGWFELGSLDLFRGSTSFLNRVRRTHDITEDIEIPNLRYACTSGSLLQDAELIGFDSDDQFILKQSQDSNIMRKSENHEKLLKQLVENKESKDDASFTVLAKEKPDINEILEPTANGAAIVSDSVSEVTVNSDSAVVETKKPEENNLSLNTDVLRRQTRSLSRKSRGASAKSVSAVIVANESILTISEKTSTGSVESAPIISAHSLSSPEMNLTQASAVAIDEVIPPLSVTTTETISPSSAVEAFTPLITSESVTDTVNKSVLTSPAADTAALLDNDNENKTVTTSPFISAQTLLNATSHMSPSTMKEKLKNVDNEVILEQVNTVLVISKNDNYPKESASDPKQQRDSLQKKKRMGNNDVPEIHAKVVSISPVQSSSSEQECLKCSGRVRTRSSKSGNGDLNTLEKSGEFSNRKVQKSRKVRTGNILKVKIPFIAKKVGLQKNLNDGEHISDEEEITSDEEAKNLSLSLAKTTVVERTDGESFSSMTDNDTLPFISDPNNETRPKAGSSKAHHFFNQESSVTAQTVNHEEIQEPASPIVIPENDEMLHSETRLEISHVNHVHNSDAIVPESTDIVPDSITVPYVEMTSGTREFHANLDPGQSHIEREAGILTTEPVEIELHDEIMNRTRFSLVTNNIDNDNLRKSELFNTASNESLLTSSLSSSQFLCKPLGNATVPLPRLRKCELIKLAFSKHRKRFEAENAVAPGERLMQSPSQSLISSISSSHASSARCIKECEANTDVSFHTSLSTIDVPVNDHESFVISPGRQLSPSSQCHKTIFPDVIDHSANAQRSAIRKRLFPECLKVKEQKTSQTTNILTAESTKSDVARKTGSVSFITETELQIESVHTSNEEQSPVRKKTATVNNRQKMADSKDELQSEGLPTSNEEQHTSSEKQPPARSRKRKTPSANNRRKMADYRDKAAEPQSKGVCTSNEEQSPARARKRKSATVDNRRKMADSKDKAAEPQRESVCTSNDEQSPARARKRKCATVDNRIKMADSKDKAAEPQRESVCTSKEEQLPARARKRKTATVDHRRKMADIKDKAAEPQRESVCTSNEEQSPARARKRKTVTVNNRRKIADSKDKASKLQSENVHTSDEEQSPARSRKTKTPSANNRRKMADYRDKAAEPQSKGVCTSNEEQSPARARKRKSATVDNRRKMADSKDKAAEPQRESVCTSNEEQSPARARKRKSATVDNRRKMADSKDKAAEPQRESVCTSNEEQSPARARKRKSATVDHRRKMADIKDKAAEPQRESVHINGEEQSPAGSRKRKTATMDNRRKMADHRDKAAELQCEGVHTTNVEQCTSGEEQSSARARRRKSATVNNKRKMADCRDKVADLQSESVHTSNDEQHIISEEQSPAWARKRKTVTVNNRRKMVDSKDKAAESQGESVHISNEERHIICEEQSPAWARKRKTAIVDNKRKMVDSKDKLSLLASRTNILPTLILKKLSMNIGDHAAGLEVVSTGNTLKPDIESSPEQNRNVHHERSASRTRNSDNTDEVKQVRK